jgi:hypothetical protein
MNRNLYYLLVILFLTSCNSKGNHKQPDTNALYVINLDSIEESKVAFFSYLFKSVKTIILETTDESVIGKVGHVQVFDNYIFLMDGKPPSKLFVFNMEGKFIRIIGDVGYGPGEYILPNDFTIDPQKKEIYILDAHRRVLKYTIEGEYITTINPDKIFSNYIQYHNGKLYVESYDEYMLNEIDIETGKRTNRFLETAIYNKGWHEDNFISPTWGFASKLSGSPKFIHLFTDIFFTLGSDNVEPYISLNSKDLPTVSDISDVKQKEVEAYMQMLTLILDNKICSYYDYFETRKHIYFSYMQGQRGYSIIFDIQNKSARKVSYLYNDLVCIFDENEKTDVPYMMNVFSTSDGVYQCLDIQSQTKDNTIFDAIEKNWLQPDLDKLEEIKALSEDSNPVIFYYSYE